MWLQRTLVQRSWVWSPGHSPTAVLLESAAFWSLGLYLAVEAEMILHIYILKATILIGLMYALAVLTAICWLFQLRNIPQCWQEEVPVCVGSNTCVDALSKSFLLLLLWLMTFTYIKWLTERGEASSLCAPRPLVLCSWRQHSSSAWPLVSPAVHPHPITPLKSLSHFLIKINISREKKISPLHKLQLYHPFPGACFVFKGNDNRNTGGERQRTSNSHSFLWSEQFKNWLLLLEFRGSAFQ